MRIVEEINHGNYRHITSKKIVGEFELEDAYFLLKKSPYYSDRSSDNLHVEIFESLRDNPNKKFQFGWADYYLEN